MIQCHAHLHVSIQTGSVSKLMDSLAVGKGFHPSPLIDLRQSQGTPGLDYIGQNIHQVCRSENTRQTCMHMKNL